MTTIGRTDRRRAKPSTNKALVMLLTVILVAQVAAGAWAQDQDHHDAAGTAIEPPPQADGERWITGDVSGQTHGTNVTDQGARDGGTDPSVPQPGLGTLDPWVDASGDIMTGSLNMDVHGIWFRNVQLDSPAQGILAYGGNEVCLSYGNCLMGIDPSNTEGGSYATVAGGYTNAASGSYATVAGGQANTASGENSAIGGGLSNEASGLSSTIGGGYENDAIEAFATVGGGEANTASGWASTASGGFANEAIGLSSTIGGGEFNDATAKGSTVSGGQFNHASGENSAIGGGRSNDASGENSAVGGGFDNSATGYASFVGAGQKNHAGCCSAVVGGGEGNTATGLWATVPGGVDNTAEGLYSFAAGRHAKALHHGTFVWADGTDVDVTTIQNNEALFQTQGGFRIFTNGAQTTGVTLAPGSGSWASMSDANVKDDVEPADPRAVLQGVRALDISTWHYESQDQDIRHMGPMAQDFRAAFGLGEGDTTINVVDADGVALAAIQGLDELVHEQRDRIDELQAQNEDLRAQNAALHERLRAIEEALGLLSDSSAS